VEPDRDAPPPARRANRRVRLSTLLVCLGAAIIALLCTRTGLLGTVGIGGSGSAEGASTWCVPHGLPTLASADRSEVLQLRDGLLRAFDVTGGRGYTGGVVAPEDMWSDDSPLRADASRLAGGRWPAGYEVRWWTRAYDLVADVLVLGSAHQARAFFEEAASTDCHRDGVQRAAARWLPQGRNLAWVNPDHARQSDVFLLRGRRVYRVAAVRLDDARAETARAERRTGAEIADALACVLPGAECRAAGAVNVDYLPGWPVRHWR
jgi:hypothetical protein